MLRYLLLVIAFSFCSFANIPTQVVYKYDVEGNNMVSPYANTKTYLYVNMCHLRRGGTRVCVVLNLNTLNRII